MRTLNELIQEMDAMPAKLAAARQVLNGHRRSVELRKETVADLEADALALVSGELDEKNKPRYTNKESRENAARQVLAQQADYRTAQEHLTQAEVAKQNAEIAVSQLEDTQRSLHVQLEAALAESRSETIRELTRCFLELARLEATRLAKKEEPAHV